MGGGGGGASMGRGSMGSGEHAWVGGGGGGGGSMGRGAACAGVRAWLRSSRNVFYNSGHVNMVVHLVPKLF